MSRRAFEITVTGELDAALSEEFEGIEITIGHGVTRLRLISVDPSALHGILNRIDALGLGLLDVHQIDEGSSRRW